MKLLRKRIPCLSALFLTLVVIPASLCSQVGSSNTIKGIITGPTRTYVSNATVILRDVGTNIGRSALSASDGAYVFTDLPSGRYDLTVMASAFQTADVKNIELDLVRDSRIDVKLTLPAAGAPTAQDISFVAASDNTVQRYVLLLPEEFGTSGPHDVLIALHGHGSDRWQFMRPTRDETRAAMDIAAKYKMIYVSPDYRGTTSWMGPRAEADLTQIIETLKKQYRVGKLILIGASMGGASALTYGVLHPELLDGVVSINGAANYLEYENFQDAISASFGGTREQIPMEYKLRSAEYWPERLTMPIAITASGQDKTVPPGSVLRLAHILQNLRRPVFLIYRENEGHQTSYLDTVTALEFAVESSRHH